MLLLFEFRDTFKTRSKSSLCHEVLLDLLLHDFIVLKYH